MSVIYLTNIASDVSGYKLALVDQRPPSDQSVATAVTDTTGSGDNIAMTATAGGTAIKWITKPFLADTVIGADPVMCHLPAKESNAAANAGLGLELAEYTAAGGTQSAFLDYSHTVELTTSSEDPLTTGSCFVTSAPTPTTIDAGNRLEIRLDVIAVGTMGGSQTVTLQFNGPTAGGSSDAYIVLNDQIRLNESQLGSGTSVKIMGQGQGRFQQTIDDLEFFEAAGLLGNDDTRIIRDTLAFERDNN